MKRSPNKADAPVMLTMKLAAAERKIRRLSNERRALTARVDQLQSDARAMARGDDVPLWARLEDAEKRAAEAAARLSELSGLLAENSRAATRLQKRLTLVERELRSLSPHEGVDQILKNHWRR